MPKKLVIIPTYNEIENIEDVIKAIVSLEQNFDILIVDDNSPDGTHQRVRALQETYPNLHLEVRLRKSGLGRAYIHGFKWALKHQYDYIFEMDADFSHNPQDLSRLYQTCAYEGMDIAIGSRYITGVNVVNWPLSRVLLSYFASVYVRFITGIPIQDTTAGFICYSRKVLEEINLDKIEFIGYAFQIEMKYKSYCKGFKIKEIPIIFTDRTKGESKISRGIIREGILGVLWLKLKKIFGKL
ncbi:MAG: polyprenol monophosphomannose synthase [Bacteroidota bacterium]|nr:polyprenol monophosphomannose synthase [Bacteroidota bacterium]